VEVSPPLATNLGHGKSLGHYTEPKVKYILRWETLGAHHNRPRKPPLPPASTLQLLKLERE